MMAKKLWLLITVACTIIAGRVLKTIGRQPDTPPLPHISNNNHVVSNSYRVQIRLYYDYTFMEDRWGWIRTITEQ